MAALLSNFASERLTAHNDVWMIKFDDEEYGPYKSQSEAVLFAIDAAEKLNEHGEKAQVVIIGPLSSLSRTTRTSAVNGRGELEWRSRPDLAKAISRSRLGWHILMIDLGSPRQSPKHCRW